jgi:energy-converting hydrogenase Eha subunit B
MAKSKPSASKPQRRPRGEIDRNYFFGDVLIKTGVACGVVLGAIALYTPFTLMGAIEDGMYDYLAVVGTFGLIGVVCFLTGRHLRREATHWDFD